LHSSTATCAALIPQTLLRCHTWLPRHLCAHPPRPVALSVDASHQSLAIKISTFNCQETFTAVLVGLISPFRTLLAVHPIAAVPLGAPLAARHPRVRRRTAARAGRAAGAGTAREGARAAGYTAGATGAAAAGRAGLAAGGTRAVGDVAHGAGVTGPWKCWENARRKSWLMKIRAVSRNFLPIEKIVRNQI